MQPLECQFLGVRLAGRRPGQSEGCAQDGGEEVTETDAPAGVPVDLRGVDEPDEGERRSGQGHRCRRDEPFVDDERDECAQDQARQDRALAEDHQPVVDDTRRLQTGLPDLGRVGAGGREGVVDLADGPGGQVRHECGDHGRGVRLGRELEGLGADEQADVEQDGHDRGDREDRPQQAEHAQEAHQGDHRAGGQRVAGTPAGLLPAGVADVHGGREGRAERGADDGARAVGQQYRTQVVVITGGSGALDVAHALGEVVDAQRDGGGEQRCDVREAGEQRAEVEARESEGDVVRRRRDRGAVHRSAGPADRGAHQERGEPDRDVSGQLQIGHETDQEQQEDRQGDPQVVPHLAGGPHGDEGDGDAGEGAEQGGSGRVPAYVRADEGPDEDDDPDDEGPGDTGLPRQQRILGLEVDRQHDDEHDDEHVRHARPVGHRGDVLPPLPPCESAAEVGVVDVARDEGYAQRRQDGVEDVVAWNLEDAQAQPGQRQHVDQDVDGQSEERVGVAPYPQRQGHGSVLGGGGAAQ
ncbi:hypothetical protein [Streptomyces cellulosae]|uniref:hypothetical protein n=1 Tax=Streptomyces cellulosae TaxID=1968 RepID=UPI001F39DC9F|nr:hypothetical protein [Streptomyces cellulosae]